MSIKAHSRYCYLYFYQTTKTSTGSLNWVAPLTHDVSACQPGIRSQKYELVTFVVRTTDAFMEVDEGIRGMWLIEFCDDLVHISHLDSI